MLKIYDLQCQKCKKVFEVLLDSKNGEIIEDLPNCVCGGSTKRSYSKFNFKLIYDNKKDSCGWAFNNYDSSHYWDDVNASRQAGNDVKPYNEK